MKIDNTLKVEIEFDEDDNITIVLRGTPDDISDALDTDLLRCVARQIARGEFVAG